MKFMKLGSKPDSFQTDGDNTRFVASEVATDMVINVGNVKFHLHKFPILSKSAKLQKLAGAAAAEDDDEINIDDIPGGPTSFEICAKFCYGMIVTLNPYNVVAARCAAEYLEMYETMEKGNLIYKIEVFLNSSILRSWKDSIIVLQSTKSLLPWSEELKIVSRCLDSIASKASMDTSMVEWSYTYNRKTLDSGTRKQLTVPNDWWVEDLCELNIDLYKRVIATINGKLRISADLVGEALNAYVSRRLPSFDNGKNQGVDIAKTLYLIETIIWLLPAEKNSVKCSFLLKLLQASIVLGCGETEKTELMKRVGRQLEEATVADLMIETTHPRGETTAKVRFEVDLVRELVEQFLNREEREESVCGLNDDDDDDEFRRGKVAKLVDGYLAEAARDPSLSIVKFVDLAEMVSGFPRSSHDGVYRAIDMFLKEHPNISKSERKRICRLMDPKKLSAEACTHAVQNERLPLRVVVQILFFEQVRATSSSSGGGSTPELSRSSLLPVGSHRSSAPTEDDDLDTDEIKALKGEIVNLRIKGGGGKDANGKVSGTKMKGLVMSNKMISKLWSRSSDSSSSETSESAASTPSRSRRQSLSEHLG